jgi:hypothetical protein
MASPIVNLPYMAIDNLQVSRAGNTSLSIAAGQCRDSTNVFDIVVESALTVSTLTVGANGIDTGAIAASKMYYVYVISDPTQQYAPASLVSLSATPVLPTGYSIYRVVGYWPSTGASAFAVGEYVGNGSRRVFHYDAITATPITAGNSATFAAVVLTNIVPPVANFEADFYIDYTANAAADVAAFRPTGSSSTNGQHIIIAPVAGATAHTTAQVRLAGRTAAGVPGIDYKVSAGAIAISVEGFVVNL